MFESKFRFVRYYAMALRILQQIFTQIDLISDISGIDFENFIHRKVLFKVPIMLPLVKSFNYFLEYCRVFYKNRNNRNNF